MGGVPAETVWARKGLGRKGMGALQRHPPWVAKAPQVRAQVVLFTALQERNTHRIACARGDRIAPVSDLMVTGNLLHAHQGVGGMLSLVLLQPALVVQKRRRWGKKAANGASGGIWDAVWGIVAFAIVRQWIDVSVEDALEIIETYGVRQRSLLGRRGITT